MNMINPNKFPARTERPVQRGSPINTFGCWETIGKRRRKQGNSHEMGRSCEIRDLIFFPLPSHFLAKLQQKNIRKKKNRTNAAWASSSNCAKGRISLPSLASCLFSPKPRNFLSEVFIASVSSNSYNLSLSLSASLPLSSPRNSSAMQKK